MVDDNNPTLKFLASGIIVNKEKFDKWQKINPIPINLSPKSTIESLNNARIDPNLDIKLYNNNVMVMVDDKHSYSFNINPLGYINIDSLDAHTSTNIVKILLSDDLTIFWIYAQIHNYRSFGKTKIKQQQETMKLLKQQENVYRKAFDTIHDPQLSGLVCGIKRIN